SPQSGGVAAGFDSGIGLERLDATEGWVFTSSSIYHTVDDGSSWTVAPNPCQPANMVSVENESASFIDGTHGWVTCTRAPQTPSGEAGRVYQTDDAGVSWT